MDAIMENIVNEKESRVERLKQSREFVSEMNRLDTEWQIKRATFEALCKVFHKRGMNVSKTQIRKIVNHDHNDYEQIINEINEIANSGLNGTGILAGRRTLWGIEDFLIPINDEERNKRAEKEKYNQPHFGTWRKGFDLETQLNMNCERILKTEARISEISTSENALKETRLEISKLKRILSDLEYQEREIEWGRGEGTDELCRLLQQSKELEYMIENHKGKVIRPPKD
tara:strand:+ start:559 stop:1245 length:687 start_codon:yes stop_codon:yes gene_type:complete